ncbi:hypothetical protein [Meiothermus taiwanensis]|jgi:hypothetical protein|uniref:Uncharacterized protein n=2 Tax=Meiothermus taiwanensis TaxID=172827 RepID=A0A399DXM0_9DEIN|nr:hypothetical protein [Meiothermus taiwanensis]AWR87898.1 hypothetical protein Mtai_v1c26700 [Meiothermus taiwanensis WR-220]KIQ53313.1 hypothetical protein SY28_14525 [Meiothermus taiwanensis]RIH74732.1 hypothetical protein Mcate_02577 [Meiothermus taiwanensis]
MHRKEAEAESIREAQRGLAWALLLGLAILAGIVAAFMGFVLVRLLPYAEVLATSSGPVTLPSGERLHPSWLRVAVATFAVALGLGLASVWGLFWLRRVWARPLPATSRKTQKKPQKNKGQR